jgi:hypothetical protein
MAVVQQECVSFPKKMFKVFDKGKGGFRFTRASCPSKVTCNEGVQTTYGKTGFFIDSRKYGKTYQEPW